MKTFVITWLNLNCGELLFVIMTICQNEMDT